MAEKVGGIEYDIDVNTGQVKKATGDVSASARAIEASFDKVDKATAKTKASFSSLNQTYSNNKKEVLDFIASQVKAGRSIDENGNVITAYGVKAKGLTEELNRLNNKFKDSASDARKVDAAFDALTREKKELVQETKEVTKAIESQNAAIKKSTPAIEKQAKNTKAASKNMGSIGRSAGQASIQIQQFTGQISGGVNPLVAFSQQAADLGIVLGAPLIGSIVGIGAALAINFVPNMAKSGEATQDAIDKVKQLREEYVLTAEQQQFLAMVTDKETKEKQKQIEEIDKEIKKLQELKAVQEKQAEGGAGRTARANQITAAKRLEETEFNLARLASDRAALEVEIGKRKQQTLQEVSKTEEMQRSLSRQVALMTVALNEGEQAAQRLAIAHSLGLETVAEIPPEIRKQIDAMEAVENKQIQMQEAEKARMIEQAELQKKISDEMREYELANKKTLSQADALMDSLRTGGMSELEKIQEDFEAKRELLLENEAILLGDKTLSDDEKIALERRTSDALVDIEYQAAKAREAILEREKQAKLNAVKSTFSNLSTLMNTESKKLFEIGKAASIANAIVAGYEAVSKTMASIPYPYNIPLAVAQAAASAAQVQGIAKQKIGGAGGGANTFSGGLPATRTTNADMGQNNNRNITVSGIDANSLISGGQLIRLLEEYIGDGGTVSFAGGG